MTNHFGRKYPLVAGMIPQAAAFTLLACAENKTYLYISRFLSGVSGGVLFVLVPIYISEISEKSNRGMLGSLLGVFYNVGIIIGYVICTYMPFYSVPYVALGILALFLLFIIFPESPQYLLLKQRDAEAEKSLRFFRCFSQDDEVKREFEYLKSSVAATSTKTSITIQDFKPATTRKALFITYIILCGRNMSGYFPLLNYTVSIFEQAGTEIDPHISAIIVAVIQLAGNIVSAYYTDKSGRRILLIPSLVGVGLCLTTIGIYFYLSELGYNLSAISWLPVASLSISMFLAASVQIIPIYITSELLPVKIRSSVISVFMTTNWPLSFIMLQFYSPLADLLGVYSCMWIFGGWCFFEAIFAYFLLPESKGKSHEEIVLALEGKVL
ncbi:facilitated trehalose transporter Tret1-like [Lutzomyia longipalpis]|uniref:facilitated trehalose transporter Tret1-like n=1 Tax=Lutzomyia longipalpis TaxID=7200 RepID=UPI0024839E0F|nr:facilitated trehalose transporter Tret1-like [Lutzomyia longipalpis]